MHHLRDNIKWAHGKKIRHLHGNLIYTSILMFVSIFEFYALNLIILDYLAAGYFTSYNF